MKKQHSLPKHYRTYIPTPIDKKNTSTSFYTYFINQLYGFTHVFHTSMLAFQAIMPPKTT